MTRCESLKNYKIKTWHDHLLDFSKRWIKTSCLKLQLYGRLYVLTFFIIIIKITELIYNFNVNFYK